MEAILAHELMHVGRHDNLTAALHMLVEAVFWFHPLVWGMERRLVEERERACDEAVIQLGGQPEAYAESLLEACRFCVQSPLRCVSGVTGAGLNKRIVSIMTMKMVDKLSLGRKLLLATFGIAAVAAPLVLGEVKAMQGSAVLVVKSAAPPAPQDTSVHNGYPPDAGHVQSGERSRVRPRRRFRLGPQRMQMLKRSPERRLT